MAKRDMKKALGASLQAEEQAVRSRFEKAKTVPRNKRAVPREEPQPEDAGEGVRDNFNIPDGEDELLSRIERRCLKAGISTNRSEVLMAGLTALDAMQDRELARLFESPPRVKTGRRGREIHIFIVHPADAVKLQRPLPIKRFQFARKVMIGHRIATITVRKSNLMNL
jgi:hypothetical protein